MNSVNSTNPFDDDYEVDSMTIASGSSHLTDHKRPRKKRRAPLPPVNVSMSSLKCQQVCEKKFAAGVSVCPAYLIKLDYFSSLLSFFDNKNA